MWNDGRDNGFAAGILTGAVVGAGLALLFAPKSGADLRHDLNGSMHSVRDAVARRYRALAEMAGVELDNLEERVDEAAAAIESSAREVLDSAASARRRPRPAGAGRS